MEIIHSISDKELIEMSQKVPLSVQIRMKLETAGFKFEDSGKLISIINDNPKPLGIFTQWQDHSCAKTWFKQVIEDE